MDNPETKYKLEGIEFLGDVQTVPFTKLRAETNGGILDRKTTVQNSNFSQTPNRNPTKPHPEHVGEVSVDDLLGEVEVGLPSHACQLDEVGRLGTLLSLLPRRGFLCRRASNLKSVCVRPFVLVLVRPPRPKPFESLRFCQKRAKFGRIWRNLRILEIR